jgi:hypothetical protein
MKLILNKISRLLAALLLLVGVQSASALSTDYYTETSRLASGRWVKISVSESGMYMLTEQQLRQWGFSDPANVKVYGYGAMRLPDRLDNTYIDDMPQTPSEYLSGQGIVFFGEGPVTIGNYTTEYFRPVQNPFTTVGYYFLSENDDARLTPQTDSNSSPTASSPTSVFRELAYHEKELYTLGRAGYLLVGENFKYSASQQFKIDLPDIVTSEPVMMEASFVAKSTSAQSRIIYTADGTVLPSGSGDNINFSNSGEIHGIEGVSRKDFYATKSSVEIGVNYNCAANVVNANLNYIALTYTRNLTLASGNRLFYAADSANGFQLADADSDTRVWDITSPLSVIAMNLSQPQDGKVTWSYKFSSTRRYAAWKPSAKFLQATYVGEVKNQNLHGLSAAEMIIFTLPQWKDQAERIAEYHRTDATDPLDVLVLTPQEIYNEFSSGAPDVQSFRKLLKMFYDRQLSTEKPLHYAMFLSRPMCDIRQLTSEVQNLGYPFLPAWFTDKGLYDSDSYSTDDIFGFLDDGSGSNTAADKLRISVGRIPATSSSDVKAALEKMKNYYTKMPSTNWKNNVLISADDQDSGVHMEQSELLAKYMLQSSGGSESFIKKLYIDQYERTSNVCEEARTVFYRYLDEGAMLWIYIGHANESSLTGESLVTYTDLNSLYLRHWPIVYAATCNFLRWDELDISGAEILFKNPTGGVIAAISATRPVYISNNGNLSASMGRHFLERRADGRFNTIGDIYRNAKNDYMNESNKENGKIVPIPASDSNKLRYVLMGDPALRITMPSSKVVVDKIAGIELPVADDKDAPCLMARQQTSIEGHLQKADGSMWADFNGDIYATLYDAEETITTQGYGDTGVEFNFEQQGGRLFAGNTKVENGKFSLQINMPPEVVNNYRNAAISLYAVDSDGNDATGVNRDFYVYGTDENATTDDVPPTIDSFYVNHPTFTSGDSVNDSPMIIAEVSDDRAINLSTAGVGHQMSLYLDNGTKSYTDVADYYTPYTDGRIGGTINYPLEGLGSGNHTIRLRVWDTAPNSADAELEFYVEKQITPTIYDVYTDCNPASTEANFYVSHDRPDRSLTVTIEVFDLMGRRLWQSTQEGRSDMFTSSPITWDLTDYGGHRVKRGIYLYRATVSDDNSGDKTATAARRLAVTD